MELENTPVTKNKRTKVELISSFFRFIKKNKVTITITTIVIGIIIAAYMALPIINISDLKIVNLDTSIKLNEGQTVQLKNKNVSVKITHLANIACPKGVICFGSGKVVEYALMIDGTKYVATNALTIANSAYQVKVESSDYKTYAIVKIIKSKK